MIQIYSTFELSDSSDEYEGAPAISSVGYDTRLNKGRKVLEKCLEGSSWESHNFH